MTWHRSSFPFRVCKRLSHSCFCFIPNLWATTKATWLVICSFILWLQFCTCVMLFHLISSTVLEYLYCSKPLLKHLVLHISAAVATLVKSLYRVATHLENLEKSGNFTLVGGKVGEFDEDWRVASLKVVWHVRSGFAIIAENIKQSTCKCFCFDTIAWLTSSIKFCPC